MLSIPMYRFNQTARLQMLDLIKHYFNLTLTEDDVTFDLPVAVGHTRTEVQISSALHSRLTGKGILTYDRVDLNSFFFGIPIYFRTLTELTPEAIRADFLAQWNIYLDPEDIEIELFLSNGFHPQRVIFTAKETALCWVGNLEGWILPAGHLGDLFNVHLISFNDRNLKRNAILYSYDKDLQGINSELVAALPIDFVFNSLNLVTQPILESLRTLTEDPWTITLGRELYNLKEAKVLYNGPYSDASDSPLVIVIQLSPYCQNLFGFLILTT